MPISTYVYLYVSIYVCVRSISKFSISKYVYLNMVNKTYFKFVFTLFKTVEEVTHAVSDSPEYEDSDREYELKNLQTHQLAPQIPK